MPKIKDMILENWHLKLMAILLAGILWLFIQGEPGTVTTVTAPVQVQVPGGMEISRGLPSTVQVIIRGTVGDLTCNINLQNTQEGETRVTLTRDNIRSPKGLGIEVIQVNPSQVVLMIERTVQKTVPITVPVQGDVADGMEVYEKIPNPNRVTITGPRSHIEVVEEVSTEIIDLDGQNQSANFRVGLNFKDGTIRSSITEPIWVEIRIGPRRKMYVVRDVPLDLEGSPYLASPDAVDVEVMAPDNLKDALVPANFRLTMDLKALESAVFPVKAKPKVWFQESWAGVIKVGETKPREVTVRRKDAPPPKN